MKKLLPIFCLLHAALFTFANKIDNLQTDSDVVRFIRPLDKYFTGKYTPTLTIRSAEIIKREVNCNPAAQNWDIKNWQKLDLNNDGLTDLAVIVHWYNYSNYIVIDKGKSKFQLIPIYKTHFDACELITTATYKKNNVLIFHQYNNVVSPNGGVYNTRAEKTDTLIYKYGNFVELNSNPAQHKIDSITFSTGTCLGSCPDFQMTLTRSGLARYRAGMYSKKEGRFKTILKKPDVEDFFALINYIDIKKLRDNYAVPWTDSPTCDITVNFADGSVKHISDYGELGTFGLRNIYSKFFALTVSQDWK